MNRILVIMVFLLLLFACRKTNSSTPAPADGSATWFRVYQYLPPLNAFATPSLSGVFCDSAGYIYTLSAPPNGDLNIFQIIKTSNTGKYISTTTVPYSLGFPFFRDNSITFISWDSVANPATGVANTYLMSVDTGGHVLSRINGSNFGLTGAEFLVGTKDGNILTSGSFTDSNSNARPIFTCLSPGGSLLWQDTLADTISFSYYYSPVETADNNYLIGCNSPSGIVFYKINHQGAIIGQKWVNIALSYYAFFGRASANSYFIFNPISSGGIKIYAMDANCNFFDSATIQPPSATTLYVNNVNGLVQKADGNLMVILEDYTLSKNISLATQSYVYELKPDCSVNKIVTIGAPDEIVYVTNITQTINNHYIFVGTISNTTANNYLFIANTNANEKY